MVSHNNLRLTAALALATALGTPQFAAAQEAEPAATSGDDLHDQVIVVTASGVGQLDMLAGTSVLSGTDLVRQQASQLGDVLAAIPGVSASSFAPGVSRPVLRGFGGERVRVLTDGVGAIDASSASDDHAVTVDPLLAARIDVLRGPAVLLFGSQAIGGAVNVITRRIPPAVPTEPVHVDAMASVDTVSNRLEGGASVDVPLASNVAFHIDGSWRDTDDLAIPGFAATPAMRARMLGDAAAADLAGDTALAAELRDGANVAGHLPDSATRTWTLGTGLAVFSGASNAGVSFDYYDTTYGVPGLPGLGETGVSIGMERYRADFRGELVLDGGLIDAVNVRAGWSDYTHTEFEDGGIPGTVFDVTGTEGRVEVVQATRGGWSGSLGGQFGHSRFRVTGDEAFLPANSNTNLALFALQQFDLAHWQVEFGGRWEHTAIDARDSVGLRRTFSTLSGAVGLGYDLIDRGRDTLRAGINLSRAERAPSAQELFADGPHLATRQYEVGDATLGTEGSWGLEGYVRGQLAGIRASASVYRNSFDGFVYQAATGAEEDGLAVYAFRQQDARQFGLEGEISLPLVASNALRLTAELKGDYVRATLADGTPVPRLPPLSLGGALEAEIGHFDLRGEVEWNAAATRLPPGEAPTDGFTLVNLSLAWHPQEGAENITLLAQVDNVFDVDARRASSFTRAFVPLPGRNFKLTARVSY